MKQRFNTIDLKAALNELAKNFIGFRVVNVYDVDSKTYLIKLSKPDSKAVILIESGIRIHGTTYDWPKNIIPSGFSMKLRKHLKSRRLEKITQVGVDRIVDMQFGSNEAAYHLIVELYDKGNICLTDHEYQILNVLRPRTDDASDVRFSVRETYPLHLAQQHIDLTEERVRDILVKAKDGDDLKKLLNINLFYGAPVIEHCLFEAGFPDKCQLGKNFNVNADFSRLFESLKVAESICNRIDVEQSNGYIIQKKTKMIKVDEIVKEDEILTYEEFHPMLFKKYGDRSSYTHLIFDSFDKTVDEFYSKLESQKLELKIAQQNKEALKKLENVKKDHEKRLQDLQKAQTKDEVYARAIENSLDFVDAAIYLVNNAVANQLDWNDIEEIIEEAQDQSHPIACLISKLKLSTNQIVLKLKNIENEVNPEEILMVDIDLGLSAFRNARRYYEMKKQSFNKEQKTIDASDKALKNAEKKTMEALKQVKTNVAITKSRKTYWFEKFYWFVSSENYLVIGGRDRQQNEILVKKHLKPGDVYVHADLHGASSVVIKNSSASDEIPPKTLNEAGCMAICYSVAWEAKVIANAYWVYHNQVSKQAPTGEYLGSGSFMIRGKKNFLPQNQLVFGFALLYKIDESCYERHQNERRAKLGDDDDAHVGTEEESQQQQQQQQNELDDEIKRMIKECEEKDENEIAEVKQGDYGDDMNEELPAFPDTNFNLNLVTLKIDNNQHKEIAEKSDTSDEEIPIKTQKSLDSKQTRSRMQRKNMKTKKNEDKVEENEQETNVEINEEHSKQEEKPMKQQPLLKRGQKAKLAKIKQKYRDQDDEDRELVMQILAPAGKKKKDTKEEQKEKIAQQKQKQQKNQGKSKRPITTLEHQVSNLHIEQPVVEQSIQQEPDDNDGAGDDEDGQKEDELNAINLLTGLPTNEDELHFCVTMCAPYNSIQNYKHKVKLLPGTTKRSHAIKTALEIFARDKLTTQREKDLIKSLKDQDTTRNLPGRVKVSAPNLAKIKAKK